MRAADLGLPPGGRRGARRACLARGMRVHRKRGEQLLSCQREPLNLPADLLTIVPASSYHHRFAFFSCPLVSSPFAPSFRSSAPNTTISLPRDSLEGLVLQDSRMVTLVHVSLACSIDLVSNGMCIKKKKK